MNQMSILFNMKQLYFSLAFVLFWNPLLLAQENIESISLKLGVGATAQYTLPSKGLSASTAILLMKLEEAEKVGGQVNIHDSAFVDNFNLYYNNKGELYVNAFLLVTDDFDSSLFMVQGPVVKSGTYKILTVSLPLKELKGFVDVEGVVYVEVAEKVEQSMDAARGATWVNWVHQGLQLTQAYLGSGVVIGIIDEGFDYTHPNFFDATGISNYRVKRVWEQNATVGIPPAGFTYGRELTTEAAILAAQKDKLNESHGTHVAGIAGGAGGGANATFTGVAPQSELVFVSTNMSTPGIANGIAYIFSYASSVNKPCVINMSLGSHFGPHDGMSIFDQYCNAIVGNGRILVGAAGNDGTKPVHLEKSFTLTNNTMYSFVQFPNSTNGTNGTTTINIWGNPNENYEVAVNIYNTNTSTFEDWTPYIQANSTIASSNFALYDDDIFSPDICNVTIAPSLYPLTNKRNVQVSIDHTAQDDNYRWAMIEVRAVSGQTHLWATGGAQFTNAGKPTPWLNGSTSTTVMEIGGTGSSVISVGAYTSKNTWTSLSTSSHTAQSYAAIGAIAPFSSKGPTADNRVKPDITAPGNILASSLSRFDNNYTSASARTVSGVTNGSNTWYFGMLAGTSMASPMVSGILALWLQAYPYLTPAQALNLLKTNAWTDSYTGQISTAGNNTWGWGKVDAHEGLKALLNSIPPQPVINPSGSIAICQGQNIQLSGPTGFLGYQWSNNANTQNIVVSNSGSYSLRVANSQGFVSPWSLPKVVTVNAVPNTPIISINGGVLSSSSSLGNQWYLNGNPIVGATQQNHVAQQNGNYHVVVTNANNCSSTSNSIAFFSFSNTEFENATSVMSYPNPTKDKFFVKFDIDLEEVHYKLFDVSGQLQINRVVLHQLRNVEEQFDVSTLRAGVYTMVVSVKDIDFMSKIVIVK